MTEFFKQKHPLQVFVRQPGLPVLSQAEGTVQEKEDHLPLLIMFLQRNLNEMTKVRKSIEQLPHDVGAGGG